MSNIVEKIKKASVDGTIVDWNTESLNKANEEETKKKFLAAQPLPEELRSLKEMHNKHLERYQKTTGAVSDWHWNAAKHISGLIDHYDSFPKK
jgi:hypothetical protein